MTATRFPPAVIVIGGYLGAGKTTLINSMLSDPDIGRVAVVVNDFGEINVDEALIRIKNADTIGLSNGCVCCSLTDGLWAVLNRLKATEPPFRAIVIEASGVSDPLRIAAWGATPGLRRGPVVVCASATSIEAELRDAQIGATVLHQLERADLVVITKADLAGDPSTDSACNAVNRLASAPLLVSTADDAVGRWLFSSPSVTNSTANPTDTTGDTRRPSDTGDIGDRTNHSLRYTSASVTLVGPIDRDRLTKAIANAPTSIIRLKGVVNFRDDDSPSYVDVVGAHRTITPLYGSKSTAPIADTSVQGSERTAPWRGIVAIAATTISQPQLAEWLRSATGQ